MLFVLSALLGSANGQASSDCVYRHGGLELDLYDFRGKLLFYEENNVQWSYSICSDSLSCVHESNTINAMVEAHAVGINECHYFGQYNMSTQPFYDFAIATWIFNYSNGEPCPDQNQQLNRTITIAYNCEPLAQQPIIVDVFQYDSCNALMQIDWQGACNPAPPPNENCEFVSGFQKLNLSTIQGTVLRYTDSNNLAWTFSPCANKLNCTTAHGTNLQVMSQINDPTGQCVKFLGVWAGDAIPFYDRTVFDGEECGVGGPPEQLNVRYYCNPAVDGAIITKAGGAGPCVFRIEIDSQLACHNATDSKSLKKTQKVIQRLNQDMAQVWNGQNDDNEEDVVKRKQVDDAFMSRT